jgi:hypothetical protein
MKLISRCLSAVICLFLVSTALAATSTGGYQSVTRPVAISAEGKKTSLYPPTDITIINASADLLNIAIPGDTFTDVIGPTTSKHLVNYRGSFFTPLALKDPYYTQFWTGVVCPFAIVTVYGRPGYYKVSIDSEYCS